MGVREEKRREERAGRWRVWVAFGDSRRHGGPSSFSGNPVFLAS